MAMRKICGDCIHRWACASWNIGDLSFTDATHCTNYQNEIVKTNGDRIRAMSDEELSEWLSYVTNECVLRSNGSQDCHNCKVEFCRLSADWLKAESEVEE